MKKHRKKQTNAIITSALLQSRRDSLAARGFSKPKWVKFCEVLLQEGFTLSLYEARQTRSKYITVIKEGCQPFKVRFSDHKPIRQREEAKDCDFFVGVTHLGVTHTGQAIAAVKRHFGTDLIFN